MIRKLIPEYSDCRVANHLCLLSDVKFSLLRAASTAKHVGRWLYILLENERWFLVYWSSCRGHPDAIQSDVDKHSSNDYPLGSGYSPIANHEYWIATWMNRQHSLARCHCHWTAEAWKRWVILQPFYSLLIKTTCVSNELHSSVPSHAAAAAAVTTSALRVRIMRLSWCIHVIRSISVSLPVI